MTQKTNHSTNTKTTNEPAPRYQVSSSTAALLDCLTQTANLYAAIADALAKYYGEQEADDVALPYLKPINDITDMLHAELKTQITEHMDDVRNLNNTPTAI